MRGNESKDLISEIEDAGFQIPMRGNEKTAVTAGAKTSIEFQIPMRGNEI